jgi:hypothetical protein
MSKTTINELEVNGETYVLKNSVKAEPKNSNIKIAILQRGWVMIGRYSEDGDKCSLENAYVIRSWGTTKGVGELALNGKQSGTKLDKAGSVTFNKLTVVALIDCEESLWTAELV